MTDAPTGKKLSVPEFLVWHASRIAREIRAGLEGKPRTERRINVLCSPNRMTALLDAFDAQTREITELREALAELLEATGAMHEPITLEKDQWITLTIPSVAQTRYQNAVARARSALRTKENK